MRFTSNEGDVDNMGVFIDVYPVDYLPKSYILRQMINLIMTFIISGLYVSTSKTINNIISELKELIGLYENVIDNYVSREYK